MAQATPKEICAYARQLYKGRNNLPLEVVTIEGIPYRWVSLIGWFAEAVFKLECNREDPVILNHVTNDTAKPLYDAGFWMSKSTYENMVLMVYEDYKTRRKLEDTYPGTANPFDLWKVYILFMDAASHYDAYGYLPDTFNDAFYYPPLKPAVSTVTTSTPAPAAAKPTQKTLQQLIDEVGHAAAKYRYSRKVCSNMTCLQKLGHGDCWAFSDFIYHNLEKRGINARIVNYKTSLSQNHRTVQIYRNGGWYHFDYKKYGIDRNLYPTSNWVNGYILTGHK